MKKVLWVVGITYAALIAHFAIAELTKLTDGRWATWILVFCVLDSVSIGWTVWAAMKKTEAARANSSANGSFGTSSPGSDRASRHGPRSG